MEGADVRAKLIETLRAFDTLMVTTIADNATIHARPLIVADVDDACEVWFVTAKHADTLHEVRADTRAVVTGQAPRRYVSLSGTLDVIHDPEKIAALWKDALASWLPQGKDDPSLVLLRLRPEIGEYWDEGIVRRAIRYLFEAVQPSELSQPAPSARAARDGAGPASHAKVIP